MADMIMKIIFLLMFGGLGIMLLTVGCRELFIQRKIMSTAVPVDAVIVSANVTISGPADTDPRLLRNNGSRSYVPEVRFAYTLGGVRYESDLLYPTIIHRGFASANAAQADIAEFQPGTTTKAFADAALPHRGFLRHESSNGPVWFIISGVLALGMLAGLMRFL